MDETFVTELATLCTVSYSPDARALRVKVGDEILTPADLERIGQVIAKIGAAQSIAAREAALAKPRARGDGWRGLSANLKYAVTPTAVRGGWRPREDSNLRPSD